jgi:AcrR family transcriptional regulator
MMSSKNKKYHHGDLRNTLLELAEEHLGKNGIDKLSLRALARDIGVSQTAPYRHFIDKNGLLAALATRAYIELYNRMIQAQQNAGDAAEGKLKGIGRAYVHFALEHGEIFKVMFGSILDQHEQYPELRDASRQAFILVHEVVKEIVAKNFANDAITDDDLEYLTNAAWINVHGLATLKLERSELFDRDIIDLERQISTNINIFLQGIKTN